MRTILGFGLVAVLAAIGCNQDITISQDEVAAAPDHAVEAVAAVADLYAMPRPPVVYDGVSTICAGGYGWVDASGSCELYTVPVVYFHVPESACDGGFEEFDDCYDGSTSNDGELIIVRVPPVGMTLGTDIDGAPGDASLPHELGHAASVQRGEGPDQDHRGHFFKPGGEVSQATTMLVADGM